MTNSVNNSNQFPAYSGITINITNPMLNPPCFSNHCPPPPNVIIDKNTQLIPQKTDIASNYGVTNPYLYQAEENINSDNKALLRQAENVEKVKNLTTASVEDSSIMQEKSQYKDNLPQSYPSQYYLNNYNYIQGGEKGNTRASNLPQYANYVQTPNVNNPALLENEQNKLPEIQEEDMSSSKEIISELNDRVAEQKELEKNGKKSRVIALTNEYIMSLENYLNNPNSEIRLMAAKEILTRLDEDKNRFDDAALNALLNKMLQDPEKLVRIAALSAFTSQLASGNDYTVQLLQEIQANPNADKEDVLQAADSLLKISSKTEIKYTPVENNVIAKEQAEQQ